MIAPTANVTPPPNPDASSGEVNALPLWFGILGAPATWAVQLQVGYALAPWCCSHGHTLALHVATVVFVLISLGCTAISFLEWQRAGGGWLEGSEGGPVTRTRFLGLLGTLTGSFFSLVILAQGIVSFFIDPCWF